MTAMQELINEIQKLYNDDSFPNSAKEGLHIALQIAAFQCNSIEKEKQQIIDAVKYGFADAHKADADKTFENYYNETYSK